MTLRKRLQQMPPGSLVPAAWVLAELDDDAQESRWIGIAAAEEISRMSRFALRAAAPKWARMMERGQEPPIRVRKKGDSDGAHWLFDEAACWALRPADVHEAGEVATEPLKDGPVTTHDLAAAWARRIG